jgi:hypothetical protein
MLKKIMESKIHKIVVGYRGEPPVVDALDGLPADEDGDEKDEKVCPWCSVSPCVWASNENAMIAWDEAKTAS